MNFNNYDGNFCHISFSRHLSLISRGHGHIAIPTAAMIDLKEIAKLILKCFDWWLEMRLFPFTRHHFTLHVPIELTLSLHAKCQKRARQTMLRLLLCDTLLLDLYMLHPPWHMLISPMRADVARAGHYPLMPTSLFDWGCFLSSGYYDALE